MREHVQILRKFTCITSLNYVNLYSVIAHTNMLLLLYLYFGLLYQYRTDNKSTPSAWLLYLMLQYNSHQCCFRCKRCLVWFQAFLTEFCWRFSAKQVLQFYCQCHCTSASYPYFIHLPLANRILVTSSIIKWNTLSFCSPFM